jgi:hypothetical protein
VQRDARIEDVIAAPAISYGADLARDVVYMHYCERSGHIALAPPLLSFLFFRTLLRSVKTNFQGECPPLIGGGVREAPCSGRRRPCGAAFQQEGS